MHRYTESMSAKETVSLHRHLGLPLVTFYGLGTIIGAGIYVLVSEVASTSGRLMPLAFLVAGVIAALTGACYAELSSRFPRAAGAVLYVDQAFGKASLSRVTGVLVLLPLKREAIYSDAGVTNLPSVGRQGFRPPSRISVG